MAGIHLAMDGLAVEGALLALHGQGLAVRAEVQTTSRTDIPRNWDFPHACRAQDVGAAGVPFLGRATDDPLSRDHLASASYQDPWIQLVGETLLPLLTWAERRRPRAWISAVCWTDPGVWSDVDGVRSRRPLLDGARLAEAVSLSAIGNFPARDVNLGGLGGPLEPLPEWILLRTPRRGRVLLELGDTFRATLIPPAREPPDVLDVCGLQICPGQTLAAALFRAWNLEFPKDGGGALAATGSRIPELQEELAAVSALEPPFPRWRPTGLDPAPALACLEGYLNRTEPRPEPADVLRTLFAVQAERLIGVLERLMGPRFAFKELILCGEGAHNGLLRSHLLDRWPQVALRDLKDLGWSLETLRPACAVLLGSCLLDQVPTSLPACTGARAPRLLGEIFPGSPQSWHRLLAETPKGKPTVSLRSTL